MPLVLGDGSAVFHQAPAQAFVLMPVESGGLGHPPAQLLHGEHEVGPIGREVVGPSCDGTVSRGITGPELLLELVNVLSGVALTG